MKTTDKVALLSWEARWQSHAFQRKLHVHSQENELGNETVNLAQWASALRLGRILTLRIWL